MGLGGPIEIACLEAERVGQLIGAATFMKEIATCGAIARKVGIKAIYACLLAAGKLPKSR